MTVKLNGIVGLSQFISEEMPFETKNYRVVGLANEMSMEKYLAINQSNETIPVARKFQHSFRSTGGGVDFMSTNISSFFFRI